MKIHEQIDEAIRLHDKLVLIISRDSLHSEWVKAEISWAKKREAEKGERVLFPISIVPYDDLRSWEAIDAATGEDVARDIREYFIPDFSDWRNQDSYQKALSLCVKDLALSSAGFARERRRNEP